MKKRKQRGQGRRRREPAAAPGLKPPRVHLERVDDNIWRIPRNGAMRVDGLIYASAGLIPDIQHDMSPQQVANVATLPGILKASLAMPDIHWGYGFPIGGVAAMDPDEGVVSPGGIGYDINCGVRLLRTNFQREDLEPRMRELVEGLFRNIPTGVGSHRKDFRLTTAESAQVAREGAGWAVEQGFGSREDLRHIEEGGCIPGADPDLLSERVVERGLRQLGTLGSGNHFTEVGWVKEVYDEEAARVLGLHQGAITIFIHTGSRGYGYQICDDSIRTMLRASEKYGVQLPDRQLCCAPIRSPEGEAYIAQMACGANYAFANRQMITHYVRETLEKDLGVSPREHGASVVYDVCHNIGKFETHRVEGEERTVFVHRKGATRAFPPGHPQIPERYRGIGQPVFIPGDMGRYSYVLVGTERAYEETWGSTCHGAGRMMSRKEAKRQARKRNIPREMEARHILVRAAGRATIDEEMPDAYKDVADVVDACQAAGIARKVAQLRPLAVIKG